MSTSTFRSLFSTVLLTTLIVGFSIPTLRANVDSAQALGPEKPSIYEKITAISSSVNSLESALEKPEELQKAKDALQVAWQGMQMQFSLELTQLEAAQVDQIILDRYTQFVQHYEEQISTLLSTEDPALLQEKLKEFSRKPLKPRPENPTPFQIAEHQPLKKLPVKDAPFFTEPKPSNFHLNKNEKPEPVSSLNKSVSLSKLNTALSAPTLRRSSTYPAALTELASELGNDPLQIFNYVYNTIEYVPYYGTKKGSYNTYLEKAGNDMDISLLLSDLLEISGFETDLKQGQVQLTPDQLKNWVAMDDSLAAAQHIVNGYVPMLVYVDEADEPVYMVVEHVWVDAYLPYSDYRGAKQSDSGYQWIPMDASLKATYSSQSLNAPDEMSFDSQTFFDNYLQGDYVGSPFEAFSSEVGTYVDSTGDYEYEEALAELTLDEHEFEFLPNTLPYSIVEDLDTFDDVPEELYHNIQYKVLDEDGYAVLDQIFAVEELANKQVVLGYEAASEADQDTIDSYGSIYLTPPYLIELKPVLRINGEAAATGTAVGGGELLDFEMHFLMPEHFFTEEVNEKERELVELSVNAGNDVAIAMNTDRLVYPEIYPDAVESTEFASDQKLYRTALNYLARVAENQEEIASIMGGSYTNVATRAFVFNGVDVTYVSGEPQTFEWKGLRLDSSSVINYYSYFGDINTHKKDFDLLFGLESSLDESSIFEDDFGVEAMSTVKGLKLINAGSIPGVSMVKIDSSNISDLDVLDLSDGIKTIMRDDINAGYVIYTADQDFTYLDWTGLVYITLDPESGDGGYTIGEGLNGGYTVEEWTDYWTAWFYLTYGTVTAEIRYPANGSTHTSSSCVYYEVYYTGYVYYTYWGIRYEYSDSWTESGCFDTTALRDGTYYIASGYGTNEVITFTLRGSETTILGDFVYALEAYVTKNGNYTSTSYVCISLLIDKMRDATGKHEKQGQFDSTVDTSATIPDAGADGFMRNVFPYNYWLMSTEAYFHFQDSISRYDLAPGNIVAYDWTIENDDSIDDDDEYGSDGYWDHVSAVVDIDNSGFRTYIYSTGKGGLIKRVKETWIRERLAGFESLSTAEQTTNCDLHDSDDKILEIIPGEVMLLEPDAYSSDYPAAYACVAKNANLITDYNVSAYILEYVKWSDTVLYKN